MYEESKSGRRLLSASQQHQDQGRVRQVKNEQAVGRPRMPQLGWVHLNRDQGCPCQRDTSCREPALDTARLTRILRNSHPPGLPITLDAEIHSSPWSEISCILLIKKDTGKF